MSSFRRPLVASVVATILFAAPRLLADVHPAANPWDKGPVALENEKYGNSDWPIGKEGTAGVRGDVDVYPSRWSLAQGESVALRVRAQTSFDVHVFRMGWYDGAGAREVKSVAGLPADPQPYPVADAKYGMAAAGWHDSLTLTTDATWTPGLYVARVDQTDGEQAQTFFVVRDDALPQKQPVLAVVSLYTHEAYNAWPSKARGGKSLYGFNSSDTFPTDADGINQAVKVSLDRPFLTGGGLADVSNYELPYLRFLERRGWEVAWCTDEDLHLHPELLEGRKVITSAGHWEYWSHDMFDHALAARDAGTSFLFLTGDTLSWQVRVEDEGKTLVGYKESWPKDPEHLAGVAARDAGDLVAARAHFRVVTRGFKNLEFDPAHLIDERRPGMLLTGVQSAGIVRDAAGHEKDEFPWADFVVNDPAHWIFEGTAMHSGDRIGGVMGYEFDSALVGLPEWDAFRPTGQHRLGSIVQVSDGHARGSSATYRAASGAEVVAMGAIAFSWALDDFASVNAGYPSAVDARAQRMVENALARWTRTDDPRVHDAQPADPNAGHVHGNQAPDPDPFATDGDPSTTANGSAPSDSPSDPAPANLGAPRRGGCACTAAGTSSPASDGIVALALAALAVVMRRR